MNRQLHLQIDHFNWSFQLSEK